MDFNEYNDEIKLIKAQNDTEFELYPLVAEIIAPTLKGLSKRYVFKRWKSDLGQIYYGISSFPDIAILDRDFDNENNKEINAENRAKLKGCVEAKAYNKRLYSLEMIQKEVNDENPSIEASQLIGEILWYKKVLYTNGKEWKFYSFADNKEYTRHIIDIVNYRIKQEKERSKKKNTYVWTNEKVIIEIVNEKITEEIITGDCLREWDEFKRKIKGLKW